MIKFLHAVTLFCSLFNEHHAPHGAHVETDLLLAHMTPRRHVARCFDL